MFEGVPAGTLRSRLKEKTNLNTKHFEQSRTNTQTRVKRAIDLVPWEHAFIATFASRPIKTGQIKVFPAHMGACGGVDEGVIS